ncbi:MAG: hypothetical protein ACE5D3_03745, partial [Candidatus Binatia bacterium]
MGVTSVIDLHASQIRSPLEFLEFMMPAELSKANASIHESDLHGPGAASRRQIVVDRIGAPPAPLL